MSEILFKYFEIKRLMFQLGLIFFFVLVSNFGFGQNCDCEVAKNELLRERYKSACFSGNFAMFEEAVTPIEKDSSVYCQQEALYWRATFNIYNSNIEGCKIFLDKESKLLDKFPCLKNQALYHNAQVNYYMHKGVMDSVVSACLKEQKIYEKLENKSYQATSLFNLSVIFSKMQQHDKRYFYLKKAVKLVPEVSDITKRANLLSGMANGYSELATFYKKKTFLDSALVLADKAIKLTEDINNTEYIKYIALSVHELKAFKEGDIEKSIETNLSRKSLLNPSFHVRDLYGINQLLAERYTANQEYDLANKHLDFSRVYANKLNEQVSFSWYKTKYEVLKKLGKHDEALLNYEYFIQLNDSVQKKSRFDKINELETKYQTELKDAEIDKLNQQEKIDALNIKDKQSQIKWLLGLVTIVVLTMLLILFYFRQRSLKNKQKILETEQRLNRARINPHFFFNGMASLQKLSLQEKSTKTTLFISRFAKIMRQSLESTYEELTTVEEEIDFLTQYLEIQKLRYPEKFEYQFHILNNIETNELMLPGMLMQPFIENAIEHGFKNIDYKGNITITFKEENKELNIIVEDNGVGFNEIEKRKDYKSRAMQIIKDRLYLFNQQHNSNASYQVVSANNNNGFKIVVTLPKLYN